MLAMWSLTPRSCTTQAHARSPDEMQDIIIGDNNHNMYSLCPRPRCFLHLCCRTLNPTGPLCAPRRPRSFLTWRLGAAPQRARSVPEPLTEGARGCEPGRGRPRPARGRCPQRPLTLRSIVPPWSDGEVRKGSSRFLPGALGCRANTPAGIPSLPQQRAAPPAGRGPSSPRFPEHSGLGIFLKEFLAEGFNTGNGLGFPK